MKKRSHERLDDMRKITLMSLYLGSYFLAVSTESYIKPKPVDFPPPKWVRNLNTKIEFGSFTSYILPSLSFSSAYKTKRPPFSKDLFGRTSAIFVAQTKQNMTVEPTSYYLGDIGSSGMKHINDLTEQWESNHQQSGKKHDHSNSFS